jgi:hypothetical protein
VPSGAASPTFNVNGTNAAKNTTATFSKAGTYVFKATIIDAQGATTSSQVTVVVNATLTQIKVTTASGNINTNTTRQFTAQTVDQFGNAMASQPSFTWTASRGTISSTGLFTAPNTAGSVTVSAAASGRTGSATATVASSAFLGLQSGLGVLVQSLFGDGSISRGDMLSIFNSAGADGKVDTSEFNDLKIIVSSASTLHMADYVQVLASDVVNGNVANSLINKVNVGNLAANSSNTVLSALVGKWFLGNDHPSAGSYNYAYSTGSLYISGETYTDEHQGALGDCYFLSSVGMLAKSNQSVITNMIVDNGDNTFTVRFFYNGKADYVTVDRYLPVDGAGRLVFDGMGSYANNVGTELWLPLLEKAYAEWNQTGHEGRNGTNTYSGIEGGWMSNVFNQVLGVNSTSYFSLDNNAKTAMINALAANQAVTIGTNSGGGYGLYGSHAYGVIAYNSSTQTFTLYNPWGTNQPGQLTWAQLQATCSGIAIAVPTGSLALSTSPLTLKGEAVAVPSAGEVAASDAAATGQSSHVAVSTAGSTVNLGGMPGAAIIASAGDEVSSDVQTFVVNRVDANTTAGLRARKGSAELSSLVLGEIYAAV